MPESVNVTQEAGDIHTGKDSTRDFLAKGRHSSINLTSDTKAYQDHKYAENDHTGAA
jgi:hypothetical protein